MFQIPGQQTTGLKNINIFVVRYMEQSSTESWNKVNDNRNSKIPIVLQSASSSASPWQEWELRTTGLNRTSVSSTSLSVLTPPPLLQTTWSIPWKKIKLFLFCSRWTYRVFGTWCQTIPGVWHHIYCIVNTQKCPLNELASKSLNEWINIIMLYGKNQCRKWNI